MRTEKHRKVTWDLTMKKKSKIYKNYMNRKIIQIYTVETLQLFTLCLWTMLQHVKVGHIALSQMVIFIFRLKTPHLIYLGPYMYCSKWVLYQYSSTVFLWCTCVMYHSGTVLVRYTGTTKKKSPLLTYVQQMFTGTWHTVPVGSTYIIQVSYIHMNVHVWPHVLQYYC